MSFALVTGASRGIGKSIANELANKKFNILLVARDAQLLNENAAEIRLKFGVEVDIFAIGKKGNDVLSKTLSVVDNQSAVFDALTFDNVVNLSPFLSCLV